MPNIEYLLPNIGRTVPPGDPGSGECRGLGTGGSGGGIHIPKGPRCLARRPASLLCPSGALPCPPPTHTHRDPGCVRAFSTLGRSGLPVGPLPCLLSCPSPGWVGALFALLHWFPS